MSRADDLLLRDLTAQSEALGRGDVTSAALTEAHLDAIARRNPQLNAFLTIDAERALRAAAASDARRARGVARGPLDGLSFGVKDNLDVAGLPTTAGMATRRGRIAGDDAFAVRLLLDAGMVLLGKLNMHEAALGATNHNPHFGRCENPHRAGFTPGGSSGGSAAAVAAGLCALALGTDTMGSVRVPASYCGVVGMKAGFGVISTRGTVACCRALDHVGPLVRSHRDLALVMPVLTVFDALCADARPSSQRPSSSKPTLRLVAASDIEAVGCTPEVAGAYRSALDALRDAGHTITPIAIAGYDFGRARRAGLLATEADLLVEHAADWASQRHNFSAELARFMAYAEGQGAAALAAAHRTMAASNVEAARWFAHGDLMLLPATPQAAFAFGDPVPANQADFTSLANMAGLPALSLPLPVEPGALPIGLQLIAPAGREADLIAFDTTPLQERPAR